MQREISFLTALALATTFACSVVATALAADVTIQPASGSGFVIKDASGANERLRVQENGAVTLPGITAAAAQTQPVCVGGAGLLGLCGGAGSGGSYSAGAGISLASGAFSIAPTYQLPQACAANQVARWNGTVWVCADGPAGFSLPYTATIDSGSTAFSVKNTTGRSVVGASDKDIAVYGIGAAQAGIGGLSDAGDGVHGNSSTGSGVFGESVAGFGVTGTATKGVAVYGLNTGTNAGVFGESSGYDGVHGHTSAAAAAGVAGFGDNNSIGVLGGGNTGPGVKGVSISGYAMVAEGQVQQIRYQGGWVKAMAYVTKSGTNTGAGQIVRCFNSQLAAGAAPIPPCGINAPAISSAGYPGFTEIDFGFQVDDRFAYATAMFSTAGCTSANVETYSTKIAVRTYAGTTPADCPFFVAVF